ncbi:MGMT family protein [Luteibacter yeojuensis]|uniref:Cysteine methyltransferase n=1 Tax=Luteibacter yeojuensis TaxID=345309 RepID=A0A7X5QX50_9GAMM|nr:MGMT family protein [Luteibacter yeojuensis]NID17050.1 cysteine methyltransferase [Luteibacter yeojuensis]
MSDEWDADAASETRARRIIEAVAAIPRGRVASYGAIAARAGYPGRARLIGKVLGEAPNRLDLPWHRVLRADGRIGIPAGTRGYREQCRRLKAEGVVVKDGRVPMTAFGLDHDLDRAIWGPPG